MERRTDNGTVSHFKTTIAKERSPFAADADDEELIFKTDHPHFAVWLICMNFRDRPAWSVLRKHFCFSVRSQSGFALCQAGLNLFAPSALACFE